MREPALTEISIVKRTEEDLKDIRDPNRGRSFYRRLASRPFYLFKQILTYKANWEGIRVIEGHRLETFLFAHPILCTTYNGNSTAIGLMASMEIPGMRVEEKSILPTWLAYAGRIKIG